MVGVLAGLHPLIALGVTFALTFVLIAVASLYAGLVLFTFLSFVAQVPTFGSSALSIVKILGLVLAIAWIGSLASRREAGSDFFTAHPKLAYVLVFFLAWAALSQTWAEDSGQAVYALSRLALNTVLFLIIFSAVRTPRHVVGFIAALVAGACVEALYGVVFVQSDRANADRLTSSISNPNELAAILVAALALSIGLVVILRRWPLARLLAVGAATLCVGGIFLTGSREGLLGLGVALAAFLAIGSRWRVRLLLISLVIVASGIFYYRDVASPDVREHVSSVGSGTGRTDLWTVAWRMVEDHPIRGVGAGNFTVSSPKYLLLEPGTIANGRYFLADKPKVTHNSYLEVWVELGLVGLALYVLIVGFCLWCALRALRTFRAHGNGDMAMLAGAVFVALCGMFAAYFFGSREYEKEGWLLLGLAPTLLAIARARPAAGL
jgi:O-antigen ligase